MIKIKIDLKQRLKKTVNNIRERITYFKDKNLESKKRYKNYKTLTSILESVDTVVIVGTTRTSVTLSDIGVGLVVVPISAGIPCALSLRNEVKPRIIINNYNKYKKQYENEQKTIKSSEK